MALDGIGSLVEGAAYAIAYWRIIVCIAASSLFGLSVVQFVPWFTGLQGIALGALGLVPGFAWQVAADLKSVRSRERTTTATAAACFGLIIGMTWGAASSLTGASFAVGGAVIAGLIWVWLRIARTHTALLGGKSRTGAIAAALGYLAGAALGRFVL